MAKYNAIIENDVVNGEGVCVSFFVQGCPHHCPGCFNKETWDFNFGKEYTPAVKKYILNAIQANGLQRNLSILGGEPLALENLLMVKEIVEVAKERYPEIKIYLWTGYTKEELENSSNENLSFILSRIDLLVDGRFIELEKDLNLKLRGSKNQRIWIKNENNIWEIKE